MGGGAALGRAVKSIKEQLRALQDNGLGYGLLRYLNPETGAGYRAMRVHAAWLQLSGSVRGAGAGGLGLAAEADRAGRRRHAEMPLAHALEVNALTLDGAEGPWLRANWTWAPALLDEAAVRDLARGWFAALEALVVMPRSLGLGAERRRTCRWWR